MAFERMDDSLARFHARISAKDQTLTLTKNDDKNWQAHFTYNMKRTRAITWRWMEASTDLRFTWPLH